MFRFRNRRAARSTAKGVSLAALAWLCLTLTSAATAQTAPSAPQLSLGPISVQNGVATVSGSTGSNPTAGTTITANGQPLGLNSNGTFSGSVNLAGTSSLSVGLRDPSGQSYSLSVPLSLAGPGGVIPASVLDSLTNAGISVTVPPDGFQIFDGAPLTIGGTVLNPGTLTSLTINGASVAPGPNGSFSQTLPGSTREVTIVATDRQGVSQTSSFPIDRLRSTIRTAAGTSVSALGARGLRIASVRYLTKGVRATKRLTAIVTVKDGRGYLVRSAIVRLRPASFQSRAVLGGQQVKTSNRIGRASFRVRLRPAFFPQAKRLFTVATARVPSASARKQTSVRLPRLLERSGI